MLFLVTEFVKKRGLFLSLFFKNNICVVFLYLMPKGVERHNDVLLHNEQFPGKVIGESEDSMTN